MAKTHVSVALPLILAAVLMAILLGAGPLPSGAQAQTPGLEAQSPGASNAVSNDQTNKLPAIPDTQSQLLAEVFPGARPETGASMAPVRQNLSSPDGTSLLNLEGGGELINNRLGLRLGGGGTLYTADKRQGLRLDGAVVQSDSRPEMLRLLLSAGSKIGQDNQAVLSAGWLNRYAWGNYVGVGDQGDNLNQYVLGLELERRLREPSQGTLPGVSVSLSGLYFNVDSKTVWSGNQDFEDSRALTRYFSEYGLGGGSQYEALAGVELSWKPLSLELRAGMRHKEYDEYLGQVSSSQDAPKAQARLNLHDLLGCQLSGYYTWDPDLKVLGGQARRQLWGPLGLLTRVEQVQGQDRPDDNRLFLGLDLWFGGTPGRAAALPSSLARAEKEEETVRQRQEAYARGDWLRPVRGSEVEYLQVMRQVQRQTRISEVPKSALPPNVVVNKQGELVFSGLPPLSSIVTVQPASASGAFFLTGGQLRAKVASLPAPADIIVQAQQSNGLFSMVRVRTSHGSVIINGVDYSINLTYCQAVAILYNSGLISSPPPSAPSMGNVPDQHVGFMQSISLNLASFASGSVIEYELIGSLPPGMGFNITTGVLSGRPERGGSYSLGVRALGTCGVSNTATFTIVVDSEPVPDYSQT
jgi:hypothetical protein